MHKDDATNISQLAFYSCFFLQPSTKTATEVLSTEIKTETENQFLFLFFVTTGFAATHGKETLYTTLKFKLDSERIKENSLV